MAFQITNITDEPSQRHVLLVGDDEITLTLNFYDVTEMWSFDVSWREVQYNGFMISLGCLHIQSLNWSFDFFCLATDGSGLAPFRQGDFSEGRCEFYIALQEEIQAPSVSQAVFPVINLPPYTGPSLYVNFLDGDFKSGEAGSTPQDKGFADVVSLSRATVAGRYNSSGLFETISADQPRFDYNPLTLAARGLLVESGATNLITFSSDMSVAQWGKTRVTVTANAAVAPNGAMAASHIVPNMVNDSHIVVMNLTVLPSTYYSCSYYAKAGAYDQIRLRLADSSGILAEAVVNLLTGTRVSGSTSVVIEPLPNGWYRISLLVLISPAATSLSFGAWVYLAGSPTFPGDGISGLYIWGAQCEQSVLGGLPSSLVQTSGTALARAADTVLLPNGSWRTTPDGVLSYDADPSLTVSLGASGIDVTGSGHVRSISYVPA